MNKELEIIQAIAKDIQQGASVQKAYMNNYIKLRRFAVDFVIDMNEPYQGSMFSTDIDNLNHLLEDIAAVFEVGKGSIMRTDRVHDRVKLRYLFCYISYLHGITKLHNIGTFLGYKDHTTIVHGREAFKEGLLIKDEKYLQIWKRWMEFGNPEFTNMFRPQVKAEYSNHSPLGIAK